MPIDLSDLQCPKIEVLDVSINGFTYIEMVRAYTEAEDLFGKSPSKIKMSVANEELMLQRMLEIAEAYGVPTPKIERPFRFLAAEVFAQEMSDTILQFIA
jgi:hypothetical protein